MPSPPKPPITFTQESNALYYNLGKAISNWSLVESGLFWLATLCFIEREHYYVAVSIFSIDAFHNKLKVVDRLMRAKYGKTEHIKKWIDISCNLRQLSSTRNYLAHYRRNEYRGNDIGRRVALEPWIVGPRPRRQRIEKPPSEAMCLKDVIEADEKFYYVWVALQGLYHEITAPITPPSKSGGRATRRTKVR
jgi:hypothetical protein